MKQTDIQVEIMLAAGLTDEEILRLAELRHRVTDGSCDDLTIEYKRIMFAKYLCDAGLIQEPPCSAAPGEASAEKSPS